MADQAPAPATEGPALICPVPRRPLNVNVASPMLQRDESFPDTPSVTESSTVSRQASFKDLIAPTLFGIYSPTASHDQFYDERMGPASPGGTGAQTPSRPSAWDVDAVEIGLPPRRVWREDLLHAAQRPVGPPSSVSFTGAYGGRVARTFSMVARALLLFLMGMGYGALVAQLPSRNNLAAFGIGDLSGTVIPGWGYLGSWGMAGVTLGSLLPWFDSVWEGRVNNAVSESTRGITEAPFVREPDRPWVEAKDTTKRTTACRDDLGDSDWALIVRGVGAFVGIVFAIRRLAWVSTLQVSLTLALANPCLWYMIDRSRQGLVLATITGLAGSAVLMALSLDIMPARAGLLGSAASGGPTNGTTGPQGLLSHGATWTAALAGHSGAVVLGQARLETVIWSVSVLFCSCLCFGNIGRRLALDRSAGNQVRGGGVR